jgi:hypothetical protein
MNAPGQGGNWSSALTRAAWTVLFVAIAAYVSWHLLRVVVGPLIVVLLLVGIIRFAIVGRRNDHW